jgi:hypothetical protein
LDTHLPLNFGPIFCPKTAEKCLSGNFELNS